MTENVECNNCEKKDISNQCVDSARQENTQKKLCNHQVESIQKDILI